MLFGGKGKGGRVVVCGGGGVVREMLHLPQAAKGVQHGKRRREIEGRVYHVEKGKKSQTETPGKSPVAGIRQEERRMQGF